MISSDSDDADDESGNDTGGDHSSGSNGRSSLGQSMSTTQEFLVGPPPSHLDEVAATDAADADADADADPDAFAHTANNELEYETMPDAHFGEAEEETAEDVPLPDGWYLYHDGDGFPYYYNDQTGESQWEAPESTGGASAVAAPAVPAAADTSAGEPDHHKLQAGSAPLLGEPSGGAKASAVADAPQLKQQVRALQAQLDSYRRGANRGEKGRDTALLHNESGGAQDQRHTRHQVSQSQLLEWATDFPVVRDALRRCEVCVRFCPTDRLPVSFLPFRKHKYFPCLVDKTTAREWSP